jgi:hypothetical protein
MLDNVSIDSESFHNLAVNDSTISGLSSDMTTAKADIATLKEDAINADSRMDDIEDSIATIESSVSAHNEYDMTFDDETHTLKLWENTDPTVEGAIPKTALVITGTGGGGQVTGSNLAITRITPDTITAKSDSESVLIRYNFYSALADGDTNSITGTAVWRVGSTTVATENNLSQGDKSFNIKPYLNVGTNTVTLAFTDSEGSVATRRWTVTLVNFNITSSFDDFQTYDNDVTFRYTPNGAIDKVIHFKLDGVELGTVANSTTARAMNYTISKRPHGAYLLDVYMTATINDEPVESNHIYKSIVFVDEDNTMPIVSCAVT